MSRFAHLKGKVIAVDFDGTCVVYAFPEVGPDVAGAVEVLQELTAAGAKIMLWTMRSGQYLNAAEQWFADRGVTLWASQKNPGQWKWTQSPKAHANIYIDDAALGCPLIPAGLPVEARPVVDWQAVARLLEKGEHA